MAYLSRRDQGATASYFSPVNAYSTAALVGQYASSFGAPTAVHSSTDFLAQADKKFGQTSQIGGGSVGVVPSNNTGRVNLLGYTDPNSPFATVKYDLGLQPHVIPKTEIASSYQDLWPGLYNSFVSGAITGNQLFQGALRTASSVDSDTINSNPLTVFGKLPAPPRVTISFNSTGGGGFSSRGVSIRF